MDGCSRGTVGRGGRMEPQSVERMRRRIPGHFDPLRFLEPLHRLDGPRIVYARRGAFQESTLDQGQLNLTHALAWDQSAGSKDETTRR